MGLKSRVQLQKISWPIQSGRLMQTHGRRQWGSSSKYLHLSCGCLQFVFNVTTFMQGASLRLTFFYGGSKEIWEAKFITLKSLELNIQSDIIGCWEGLSVSSNQLQICGSEDTRSIDTSWKFFLWLLMLDRQRDISIHFAIEAADSEAVKIWKMIWIIATTRIGMLNAMVKAIGGLCSFIHLEASTLWSKHSAVLVLITYFMYDVSSSRMKVKEIEGTPLLDEDSLKALLRLLRLAQFGWISSCVLTRYMKYVIAHTTSGSTVAGVDVTPPPSSATILPNSKASCMTALVE
ncbi:hypothetical protein C5167_038557 [Papaver somniferum]|uniref:Uncharacterized protein n=1 Tax=Papaver somniferum TaxID=3469 RepID=A0A4Y7I9I6_PAPSO|nr:hypothetical protein C5167_038557 [Papaver somniferum]